jgi:putative DNA primase/helicase
MSNDLIDLEQAERLSPPPFEGFEGGRGSAFSRSIAWPDPKPLPNGLLPVAPFDLDFLPTSIGPWVADIADRMQCPLDFVGISATVALGAVIGRKIGVRPQLHTDWIEVSNLWGCIVGRPGAMKSPAMHQALMPMRRLEAAARKEHGEAAQCYAVEAEAFKLRKEDAAKKARAALKGGGDISGALDVAAPEEPKARRYVASDATYEALGVILADNPNGVLAYRDELISLLRTLDREEFAAARGFFLTAWNGTAGYTFDRIIRGVTHIEAACVSMLGSTQPGRLAEYVRRATSGGAGDDGLIQRFGLLVWPDQSPEWRDVDRYPNSAARDAAWTTFERLDRLTPDAVKAEHDTFEPIPFLRFEPAGHATFSEWRAGMERRLQAGDMGAALESHIAKYRKLVPALALIAHLADDGCGPITEMAVLRAVAYAEYLETHARRAYGAGSQVELAAAKAILARIRKGDLLTGFTARDVHQSHWSGLTDREQVQAGLDLLVDLDWIAAERVSTSGRPRLLHHVNPRAIA